MKKILCLLLALFFVAACAGPPTAPGADSGVLIVTDGSIEKTYTVADLKTLPETEATFREVAYLGVSLEELLRDAGFDVQALKAVKAVAQDGFTANYDPVLAGQPDTLVAYARAEGPLMDEDGIFRMVLPDQEGKLNVRVLSKIEVIP